MKKIINGRVYDTSTASFAGTWDNGVYGGLDSVSETLYRKHTGEYFLLGEGGARSKYAKTAGDNHWSGGVQIIPLTWDAARQWSEEHLDPDAYEDMFGEVTDDASRVTVTLSLSVSAVERAKRAASQAGTNLSAYIEHMIISKDHD